MRKGLTEIVLVLDRSGSMEAIKNDAEGGLRVFVEKQKAAPGEARLTFYRFDNEIERVFEDRNIRFVEDRELRLEPRGSTALLDAMGRAINEVGDRLRNRREEDRPEHVVFITVTDGEENSSNEFVAKAGDRAPANQLYSIRPWNVPASRPAIFDMIKRQRDDYNWEFVFIGCTQESIALASKIGVFGGQTLSNAFSGGSYQATYSVLADNVVGLRSTGDVKSLNFTAQQRKDVLTTDATDDSVKMTTTDGGKHVAASS